MSAPRIAVIVPCYDDGATLGEALASARDVAGAELVVVNDGSTEPETLGVLQSLRDAGVVVIDQDNQGLSRARTRGLLATSAPYLFPLDADDVLVPGALERLADALDEDGAAAFAWGDIETFGATSFSVPSAPCLDPWLVTYVNALPAMSMFRRSSLVAAGGWTLEGGYEDWDLWMTLAERGEHGRYVAGPVIRYRRDEGGLLMTSLDRFAAHVDELRLRHPVLFSERSSNRRGSSAPRLLKILVPLVDRLPRISPLTKVVTVQFLTVLLWNGGPRRSLALAIGGLRRRARRLRASGGQRP